MSLQKIENAIGEIPPFPVPVDYDAPMPTRIGSRDNVRSLLGMVGMLGGDADFAFSVYNTVGLQLLISEVGIVKDLRQRPFSKLGVPPEAVQQMGDTYQDIDDVGSVLVKDGFGPFQLTGYFSWLHDALSGNKVERVIIPNETVMVLGDSKRPGLDIMSFRRFITPYNLGNSQIDPDQLLAGSGIEFDCAVELTADLRDGFFNYLARLTTSSAALIGLQAHLYYNYNTPSTEQQNMTHLIRPEIGRILNNRRPRLEQMAQIRKLFPAIILTANRLAEETGPLDYNSKTYYGQLISMLERVGDLKDVQRIAGVKPLKDLHAKGRVDEPVVIVEHDLAKSVSDPRELINVTIEHNLATAEQIRQSAEALDIDWQTPPSAVKRIPGYSELLHVIFTGEGVFETNLSGITKKQAKDILGALGKLQELANEGLDAEEIKVRIDEFAEEYALRRSEFEASARTLGLKQRKNLGSFPESGFLNSQDYILNNRTDIVKAIRDYKFGNVETLAELVDTIFRPQVEDK